MSRAVRLPPFEKLDFLIAKHSHRFVRGPLVEMMLMVEAQTENSDLYPGSQRETAL